MIPRRIFTTWITDGVRDRFTERHREMFAHCAASWLRVMPDYALEVVTLGTLAADWEARNDAWLQARLAEGNFIGASQWARLVWLRRHGGIFLDADVEVVRRFDALLETPYTIGHLGNGQRFANNAVLACVPDHPFVVEQLRHIRTCDPKDPEFGNLTGPFMVTTLLGLRGWDGADRDATVDGISVRRSAVFHPYSWNEDYTPACVQEDTLAVHHWASSWRPRDRQTTHAWREGGRA